MMVRRRAIERKVAEMREWIHRAKISEVKLEYHPVR